MTGKKAIKVLCLYFFFLLNLLRPHPLCAHEQQENRNYSIKANIIYHITKYINWPQNNANKFVIGVTGSDEAFSELKRNCTNRMHDGVPITVVQVESETELSGCDVVFITSEEKILFHKYTQLIRTSPVLIITEEEGLAHKGSCINFIVIEDKLKIELNKSAIESKGLKVSSDLISMSILVN